MKAVQIDVPASAANLGPGFDCLALAIDLVNTFQFITKEDGLELTFQGAASENLVNDETNLVARAFFHLADQVDLKRPGLTIHGQCQVPIRSGLGSSSTAVIAGLLAANALLDLGFSHDELLSHAADIEGHADNSAAALFGGLAGVYRMENGWAVAKLPLVPLQLVIVVPDLDISTRQMREVLPRAIPREQAINNAAHLLLMQQALATADFARMRQASFHSFHQAARLPLIPGAEQAIAAGRSAGAAVVLAGAGPGLLALAPDNHRAIAAAMQAAFEQVGLKSKHFVAATRHQGALIHPLD